MTAVVTRYAVIPIHLHSRYFRLVKRNKSHLKRDVRWLADISRWRYAIRRLTPRLSQVWSPEVFGALKPNILWKMIWFYGWQKPSDKNLYWESGQKSKIVGLCNLSHTSYYTHPPPAPSPPPPAVAATRAKTAKTFVSKTIFSNCTRAQQR